MFHDSLHDLCYVVLIFNYTIAYMYTTITNHKYILRRSEESLEILNVLQKIFVNRTALAKCNNDYMIYFKHSNLIIQRKHLLKPVNLILSALGVLPFYQCWPTYRKGSNYWPCRKQISLKHAVLCRFSFTGGKNLNFEHMT